ncbi:band 3 anion transport protein isoform X2 [Anoplophora glabripennis]|uniref:band 3 anion transport protein isoform X2 n=1 Tax=Anoplophora glabripennis TaxID=217634 RepID=UPI0008750C48|nr:band 3 anion transport protein isoform X2 [Anoplophora glabripennis]XP_018565327.1 band 3 anion transport protein isoform X2 [Anoplophora glabripennis]XP_018565328.1 band 3 anion transport protein isoform X2 [Anoplophora glabripennis]XP_018565331.1 band 3 anion transport protein isoform X2 [Anoplophora glabripennis]
MSDSVKKTNLRKLSFLGFQDRKAKNDGSSNGGEPQLDEECAKVFAMDTDVPGFDFHDTPFSGQPKYGEKDYMQHRKNYPHMHQPLKIGSKSMRRRTPQQTSPATTPSVAGTPKESITESPTLELPVPTVTPLSSTQSKPEDSDTGPLGSLNQEETDTGDNSSESECVLSDPCNYLTHEDDGQSPERKVSFVNTESSDKFDVEGLKDKKKRHHHRPHHSKFRKYSLPDDPHKKRHHGDRRISTQPEDQDLPANDRNQLDSHRSDDSRALRRHKTSRPSNASLMHIGKGTELHPSLKKLYDHSPHAIFVQLDELFMLETHDEREWKETARWIKYEEDVEEGVDRWGKPHVASLSFHSLLNLRRCLEEGLVVLDMEEKDLPAIAYRISEDLFREDLIKEEDKAKIMRVLLLRHRHVNEHHDKGFRFTTRNKHSYTSLQNLHDTEKRKVSFPLDGSIKNGDAVENLLKNNDTVVDMKEDTYSTSNEDVRRARNDAILRRIPVGAEGSAILVGEADFLDQPAIAFIRLAEGVVVPSLIEVNIPVRFIFLLLGPKLPTIDYHEVGRSISTLMANQHFHNIAYKADSRKELLSAINDFLDDSIVLPPGDWERQALLPIEEIKAKSEAIKKRKENALKKAKEAQGIEEKPLLVAGEDISVCLKTKQPNCLDFLGGDDGKKPPYGNPLERTKKPWGGLINDVKRRYPYYKSDITDGLNVQCLAAAVFMYFAAVSGAIAFGGLTGDKTKNYIGICETLLATSMGGIIFAIFAAQPLVIVGTTGALLLFDESLFQFCLSNGIEFLTARVYIGMWLAVIGVLVACFEGSVFVKLFSRFTEDIFSSLIVLIYIIETVMKICYLYQRHPLLPNYCEFEAIVYKNVSYLDGSNTTAAYDHNKTELVVPVRDIVKLPTEDAHGIPINRPNTALFCTILTLTTFAIAYYLRMFRNSQFLGRSARRALGDFGVPIAIVCMVFVDYMVPQTYTEKLNVPEGLSPSDTEHRGWFIPPGGTNQPFPTWLVFATAVPAMLVYILLFMETQISELIISKPERKLKKGTGLHLDIVIVCLTNIICGFFGLPWLCVAAVRSIVHTSALTVMSRTHAPGEKPHLIEVKEQRLSALVVSLFVGLSVLMAPFLRLVPMAVVVGIFLYMGVASIDGIQFFDRMKLLFMPVKHHPQASYVRKVKTAKMHLFTFIQLICLVILWVVKSTKASLAFPFFLILMVPLRAHLKHFFSQRELRALDGDQPDVDDDEPDFYAEAPLPG